LSAGRLLPDIFATKIHASKTSHVSHKNESRTIDSLHNPLSATQDA
jgi:hypothetical protein